MNLFDTVKCILAWLIMIGSKQVTCFGCVEIPFLCIVLSVLCVGMVWKLNWCKAMKPQVIEITNKWEPKFLGWTRLVTTNTEETCSSLEVCMGQAWACHGPCWLTRVGRVPHCFCIEGVLTPIQTVLVSTGEPCLHLWLLPFRFSWP